MTDDKLFRRFLEDQSKIVQSEADQSARPNRTKALAPTSDAVPPSQRRCPPSDGDGQRTLSRVKSITFTPSMFGYDDIDADSSVSQDNPARKPLRGPSRDIGSANAHLRNKLPPTQLPSPAKAGGDTLEQVRDQVRENRTERKRDNKARLLGRPVSKGGKGAAASVDKKHENASKNGGGRGIQGKVIDKKSKQALAKRTSTKTRKYHEALIHDATVAGKSRLTLPKGIFDRVKAGAGVGDLDFSKLKPPPAPSPPPPRARTFSNHVESSRSSQLGVHSSSIHLGAGALASSRVARSPQPPTRTRELRTSSPPRVLSIHGPPDTPSPRVHAIFAAAGVQTGPTLLGIPSRQQHNRYSSSPPARDSTLGYLDATLPPPPDHHLASACHDVSLLPTSDHLRNSHAGHNNVYTDDKDDDVLCELKHLARQVPDYGRRHSSTRPDTRDRSSIHLVGDPTLIMEGGGSDHGDFFTDEPAMPDQDHDTHYAMPAAWVPNPVTAFSSAKRPFFHLPDQHHVYPHHHHSLSPPALLASSRSTNQHWHPTQLPEPHPHHASDRPATSQPHWARSTPGATFVAPLSTRFGSVQPVSVPRRTSRGWSHV